MLIYVFIHLFVFVQYQKTSNYPKLLVATSGTLSPRGSCSLVIYLSNHHIVMMQNHNVIELKIRNEEHSWLTKLSSIAFVLRRYIVVMQKRKSLHCYHAEL